MPTWILPTATILVALAAIVALIAKKRTGTLVIAAIVVGLLALVDASLAVLSPFVLVYLALLLSNRHLAALWHGVAVCAVVLFALREGSQERDHVATARAAAERQDWITAFEAWSAALRDTPEEAEVLEGRAQAAWSLHYDQTALSDISRATEIVRTGFDTAYAAHVEDPKDVDRRDAVVNASADVARLLRIKSTWFALRERAEPAIAELDKALEHPLLANNGTLRLGAADLRLYRLRGMLATLVETLERDHPDRSSIASRVATHLRAARPDSKARQQLVDPLPSNVARDRVGEMLDEAWHLLHDADATLGDIRASHLGRVPPARMVRAELDIRLGRFLRAKEELQCLLAGSMAPVARRQALLLLAELLEETGSHFLRTRCLEEIVQLEGGAKAPLRYRADHLEAWFDAADAQPDLRADWIAAADAHLAGVDPVTRRSLRTIDMRTLGYRGVAALRFEEDPAAALALLRDVYDALRFARERDPSILRPDRARIFVEALLDSALQSPAIADRQSGIAYADTLIEVSSTNPDLRRRRAALFTALGRHAEAAADLLEALRNAPLDDELFAAWLEAGERVLDDNGRSPRQIAMDSAKRASEKLKSLRLEFERRQALAAGITRLQQRPEQIQRAYSQVFEQEGAAASNPLVAWYMAEEFGKLGETDEARNFLFRSVVAEPDVLPFRMRLAELRLDLGLYGEAASDFVAILRRDPTNVEVARLGNEALRLAGDLLAARRLRLDAMNGAPETAGIEFAVRAALEVERVDRAFEILAPYLMVNTPQIASLIGLTRLAAGHFAAAEASLGVALTSRPEDPELAAARIRALARLDDESKLLVAIQQFAKLPRLLPLDDLLAVVASVEDATRHHAAATLCREIQGRFPADAGRRIAGRAALAAMRGGDIEPLRAIAMDPVAARRHEDDVVRGAFGLLLREQGAFPAGRFLQNAREYTSDGEEVELALALAFALTPHDSDVATFLSRYERRHSERPIPVEDAVAWWCARQRSARASGAPTVAPGAMPEIEFLKAEASALKSGDDPLLELYIRFLLFRYAGSGFDADAAAVAERIVAIDARTQTAARFLAERLERDEGPTAAASFLATRYAALPADSESFAMLGRLKLAAAATADELATLAAAGKSLFPEASEPSLLSIRAALMVGTPPALARAAQECFDLLDRLPHDLAALSILVEIARATRDETIANQATARICASSRSGDPALRQFLLECAASDDVPLERVGALLGPVVAADPTFFAGARVLASALGRSKMKAELLALAERVASVATTAAGAAVAGDEFAAIALQLEHMGELTAALELVDAGLLADPGSISLRRERVDLLRRLEGDDAAIEDLEVLCALAPQVADLLLVYGDLLIQERGDRLDVVVRLLPTMRKLAPEDPRLYDLLSKWHFLRPRQLVPKDRGASRDPLLVVLDQVSFDLFEALRRAPARPDFLYRAGVVAFLLGNAENARAMLERIPKDHRFQPRVQFLIDQLESTAGAS
jgi:tetratricopeptide (TPR) repeat protein